MARAVDGRDLLETYQPGNSAASERIVRAYQDELLRACFLLTGSADGAGRLARASFLDFFRGLLRDDVADDPREALLGLAVQRWMAGDLGTDADLSPDRGPPSMPGFAVQGGPAQRFHVEDERSRVLTALGRLSPSAGAALVLREFDALDEEAVCRILGTVPHDLRRELQPARTKLLEAAGGGQDHSARELLVTAATSAPRLNLWLELEGPLDDLRRQEEERRQRYTYAAAALVGLALLAAAFWLFGFFPGGDDETTAALAPIATPTPAPTATPEPTATPIPDISSYDLPDADVPARLLITSVSGNQDMRESGMYAPATGEYLTIPTLPDISPDGRYLISWRTERDDAGNITQSFIAAIDSTTGEVVWETPDPAGRPSSAMTADAIYFLGEIENRLEVVALDLDTGEETGRWTHRLDVLPPLYRTTMKASPDGTRLFIAIDEIPTTSEPGLRMLMSFSLPDMTFESYNRQRGDEDDQMFPFEEFSFYDALVTPDGEYMYAVASDAVLFRNAEPGEGVDVALPFSPARLGDQGDLRWTTSNDGRYLYIIALDRREAVVVDLLGRGLVRAFPIDLGEFRDAALMPSRLDVPGTLLGVGRASIALSPDGSRLYVAGGLPDASGEPSEAASLIWVIDLTTWRVANRWEITGTPMHLTAMVNALYIHAFDITANQDPFREGPPFRLVVLSAQTGEVVSEDVKAARPEWAESFWVLGLPEVYRAAYGRLPAVDHVPWERVEIESTLPRIEVAPSTDAVPEGATLDIEARVVDPATGDLLTAEEPGVRFDLESTAVMRLRHESGEAEDLILIATQSEPGVYRASATIAQTGSWSIEVTLTSPDGAAWAIEQQRVFAGVPSFEATDGKRYILNVETDPAEPGAGQKAAVIARFVDLDSGDPLPQSESLLRGAPDTMRLMFVVTEQGFTSAAVKRVEDGSYEGTVSFPGPGVWPVEAAFAFGDGDNTRVGAGLVTVNAN